MEFECKTFQRNTTTTTITTTTTTTYTSINKHHHYEISSIVVSVGTIAAAAKHCRRFDSCGDANRIGLHNKNTPPGNSIIEFDCITIYDRKPPIIAVVVGVVNVTGISITEKTNYKNIARFQTAR